jgi:type VI secretion system ImpA family protein
MIDLQRLLAPISEQHPTGDDLRYEGTYDRIREARREDDPTLPTGVWQSKLKKADWAQVRDLTAEVLTTKSKDLQIAVWLTEALINVDGFAGLTEGLGICTRLCQVFWDKLYPRVEGDDVEARILPIVWINDKLIVELQRIPLTQVGETGGVDYSWGQWEHALRLDQLANRDRKAFDKAEAEGEPTRARFTSAASRTPETFYVAVAADIATALAAVETLSQALDEKCGQQAPSLSRLTNFLVAVHGLVAGFLRDRGATAPTLGQLPATIGAAAAPAADAADGAAPIAAVGPIRSREDAYQRLREAAEYLLRTEPHSPTPYLVRRAVSWGTMPLAELLREIIKDEGDLAQLYRLLGMAPPTKASK